MTTLLKQRLDTPISSQQDLFDYLARGARPRDQWGIGVEVEKLVLDSTSGEAASLPQISALLEWLERTGDWQGVRENGRLIALKGYRSSITLEPGGQLELSGELCADIHCCRRGFERYQGDILAAAKSLGLTFLGLGVQPFTPLEKIDWMPKSRYGIMGPYMLRTGDMGQRMMKQSAGLQVNLDYSDEADCIDKLRLCMALSPLIYALFANSPIMEDAPTGFLSTRGEIWSRTDADRTGLLPQLFEEGAGFATSIDYALDVPMYFIVRNDRYIDLTGERFSFRRYLEEGFAGQTATLSDWDLHLSTLFPEVRLRPQIEVRSADSLPPALTLAVAALLKGLLYDEQARREAWDLFSDLDAAWRRRIYRDSWRLGLKTPTPQGTLLQTAREIVDLARRSLVRQHCLDEQGEDESQFLEGIEPSAASGTTLAERLLEAWKGSRTEKLDVLKKHCAFTL